MPRPRTRGPALWLGLLAVVLSTSAAQALAADDESAFAGADTCRTCHRAIYDSWKQTKHATAIEKLQYSDRRKECITCHVTGSPEMIAAEQASPSHPNVQCEACHGAAAAHAKNPAFKEGLVASPGESACTRCHNSRSPHYRGFVFAAMKMFVHGK